MLKKIKELLKDVGIYGITSIASQFIGFLLLPLYTSYLSPTDYGILAMVGIVKSLFITLGNLGLKSAVMRFVSKSKTQEESDQYYATIYLAALAFSSVFLFICFIFSRDISLLFLDNGDLYFYIVFELLASWLLALGAIPASYLRIKRKVWTASIGGILNLTVTILSTILLVVVFEYGVLGAILGSLAGTVVQKIYFLYYVSVPNWRLFDRQKLKEALLYSYPYIPHYLFGVVLTMFGQFMVKEMLSIEAAGLYNIAYRFSLPLVFIVDAFNKSWGAYQFEIYENDPDAKNTYKTFFSLYTAFTSLMYLGLALYGGYLLKFMVDEKFHSATEIIPYIALIPFVKGIYLMLSTSTYYSTSPKFLPIISFIGAGVLVIMAFLLVPLLEANGAAIATSIGWACMALGAHIYAQKIFYIPYDWKVVIPIWLLILIGLILDLKIDLFESWSFLAKTVGIFLFCIFSISLFYSSESEKRRIMKIIYALKERFI